MKGGLLGAARTVQPSTRMQEIVKFFRANPQVFVLLVICVVLGLGTFLAVIFGLVSAGSTSTTGEPTGWIPTLHAVWSSTASL